VSAEIGQSDYGQHLAIHDSIMHVCRQQFKSEYLLHNLASEADTHTLFCMGAVYFVLRLRMQMPEKHSFLSSGVLTLCED
jgi:hypothetical protein